MDSQDGRGAGSQLEFGKQLARCRKAAGLTQKELAAKVHVDPSTISRFEAGRKPRLDVLRELVGALKVCEVSADQLASLCQKAGHDTLLDALDSGVAHPAIADLNRLYEISNHAQAQFLARQLLGMAEVMEAYLRGLKSREGRRWDDARDSMAWARRRNDVLSSELDLQILADLADTSYNEGRYRQALEQAELCAVMLRHIEPSEEEREHDVLRAKIFLEQGSTYRRLAQWADAKRSYGKAYALFARLKDEGQSAACRRKLAAVLLFQCQVGKARRLCERCLVTFERLRDARGVYKTMQHQAWGLSMEGRWETASELANAALSRIEQIGLRGVDLELERAKASMYTADIYRVSGEFVKAKTLYLRAEHILEELEKRDIYVRLLRGMVWLGLGQTCLQTSGEESEAERYLQRSAREQISLGEPLRIPLVENAFGVLLLKQGKLRLAEGHLRRAKQQFAALDNRFFLGETLVGLARLYQSKHDLAALDAVHQEAERPEHNLFSMHIAWIRLAWGATMLGEGQYSRAADLLLGASEAAAAYNSKVFLDVFGQFIMEIDELLRSAELEEAADLCDRFTAFWRLRPVRPEIAGAVRSCVERAQEKRADITVARLDS